MVQHGIYIPGRLISAWSRFDPWWVHCKMGSDMADRKGKPAKAPFTGYVAYEVFHKNEGRWYVCLVSPFNGKDRHTTSRARYRMAVKLGRELLKQEQVDHINGDKTDDRLGNLQILSSLENNRKYIRQSGRMVKMVTLRCPVCDRSFDLRLSIYKYRLRIGGHPCCSHSCGGKLSHGK